MKWFVCYSYNLYKLFYEASQLLEKNGIVYWIIGGTFLGAVRSGGIIKWDDDIDIMIPIDYKDKLNKLFKNNDKIFQKCILKIKITIIKFYKYILKFEHPHGDKFYLFEYILLNILQLY